MSVVVSAIRSGKTDNLYCKDKCGAGEKHNKKATVFSLWLCADDNHACWWLILVNFGGIIAVRPHKEIESEVEIHDLPEHCLHSRFPICTSSAPN